MEDLKARLRESRPNLVKCGIVGVVNPEIIFKTGLGDAEPLQ
jgi:hypothetical protein